MTTNSIKRKKALALYAGFFSCLVIGGISCKERNIGTTDAIPQVDNIHTFETGTDAITLQSLYDDSLVTNDYTHLVGSIGKIDDPFFGKSVAGLYFQVSLPNVLFAFPSDAVMDSSVVSLPYYISTTGRRYVYGDTTQSITFNAYRITDAFEYNLDKALYAHDSLGYDRSPLGSRTVTYREMLNPSVLANGDTFTDVLRIRLSSAFTNEIAALDPDVYFPASAEFKKYFPGFYIAAAPQPGNMFGLFTLLDGSRTGESSTANLTFYYHTTSDATPKKAVFSFANNNCAWFNSIRKDYNGYPASAYRQASNIDSVILQGAPGIKTDIRIAIPQSLPKSVIHKAELELTLLDPGASNKFIHPVQLIVKALDADGNEHDVLDKVGRPGFEYIGGWPDTVIANGNTLVRYKINIPRELQKQLDEGATSLTLRVYPTTAHPGFYRGILGGPGSGDVYKPKFNIIYSVK